MRRRALFFLVASFVAVTAAGCGGGEETSPLPQTVEGTETGETATGETETEAAGEGDPAAGKEVFASAGCGSCHALEDAGTSGTVGPNLDESKPDFDLAVERVTNGMGVMPSFKDQLSEEEIRNVAAYVSEATSG